MRNWYDLAVQKRGRTTAGTTGLEPDEVVEFIAAFIQREQPSSPMPDAPPGMALKMATEDLKAYYFEAITAQPGYGASQRVEDWLYTPVWQPSVLSPVADHWRRTNRSLAPNKFVCWEYSAHADAL